MKVISGFLKGRNIEGYNIAGTRPTQDRVKESMMASIQNHIKDAIVLDLFAGSGQLGIETISNGARLCYFIDNNSEVINILKKTITKFQIQEKSNIINSDWKKALNTFGSSNNKFDIIFVDPPYDYDVYEKIITKINELDLLNKNGILVLEYTNKNFKDQYDNLILIKEKKYGFKSISIYKKRSTNEE